jgi:prepilin-type N-terminal cleavage/methylation domain-containing protein
MLNRRRRRGFSLIELLIVIAIILIIITMAVPKYRTIMMFSRETSAMNSLKTIAAAELTYQSQYGRFAASLAELGPPTSGAPNPAGAELIGNDLANGVKEGYKFSVAAIPGGYTVNANPVVFGSDGSRTFYTDQTMVIRENRGPEPATSSSNEQR